MLASSATLCEGWQTRDLAAHLYLREHRAAVALGLIAKPLSKVSDKATRKLAEASSNRAEYTKLVEKFHSGPALRRFPQ